MIFNLSFQYVAFLIVFGIGFATGFGKDIFNSILVIFKNNNIAKNVLDFVFCLTFALLFFLSLNYFNYGQFRLYLFFAFILGFVLQRKMLGKLFAKLFLLVYNKTIKLLNKFKTSKVGLILFR